MVLRGLLFLQRFLRHAGFRCRLQHTHLICRVLLLWHHACMLSPCAFRNRSTLITVEYKSLIKLCNTGKKNRILSNQILKSHKYFVPHVKCSLKGKAEFLCRALKRFPIKRVPDKISSNRLNIMGVSQQGIGCMHKCLCAVFAKKALFSIPVTVFIMRLPPQKEQSGLSADR